MSAPVPQATVQTAAPAIPFKRDGNPSESPLAGGAVGVLVVSLIAIAAVLVIRKRLNMGATAAGKPGLLRVLETQRMGPRALLSVVEFSGKHYLVAQGEQGITCLASAPKEEAQ